LEVTAIFAKNPAFLPPYNMSMTVKLAEQQALSNMFIERWELAAAKIASLARGYPEEKYEAAPAAGVRTFAEVLRHVAFWNQYVADTARGKKADDSANELPKAKYATKARMITALTKSSDEAIAALREHQADFNAEQALLAESFIEHICEHYGQLVIYARLSGVVPPASRT
jgi:uncharacterized damage-inducible protein DinB